MSAACNELGNYGFEGGLNLWTVAPGTVATAATGDLAYSGNGYLDITTTVSNPSGSVSQDLYWLDTATPYNLTVQVQLENPISSVNSCEVSAYLGDDAEAGAIASDLIWNAGEWLLLRGSITPPVRDTTLNLVGRCSFSGEVTEAHVLFDEVVFGNC
ncbi:hypothetical protein BDW69DRAFT_178932 [Aspergillus filifer]